MDGRFTLKDFVLMVLLLAVIGVVVWASFQFSYTEKRVNAVRDQVQKLNDVSQQQLVILSGIEAQLKRGVQVGQGATATQPATAAAGIIRRKTPGGGLFVEFPNPPKTPRDPRDMKDYAPGDWLVQNLGSEPAVVTPLIDRDAYGSAIQGPVLETLLTQNPETFDYEPLLAKSYEVMPDGLTYRYVLRKGVTFSDGTPLTMADVLFSFQTAMNPGIDDDQIRSYLNQIESVKAIDDQTLEVKLKQPYFKGLEVGGAFVPILPEHVYKFKDAHEYNQRTDLLVGTGPYLFDPKAWIKGQQITMLRNPNYWGERPTFDRLIYRFISNPQASLQALQEGQIDFMSPLPDQFRKFVQDPEFTKRFITYKYQTPTSGYMYIGYNLRKPMFQDKLTRQALTQLLDRDAINQTIGQGLWFTVTGPFSPITPQSDAKVKPWPYSIEEAKKKLAEAGWKKGSSGVLERNGAEFKFNIMIPSQISTYEQIAAYIKEQYKKVGIDATIQPFEFSVLVDRLDTRQFDVSILRWGGGGAEQDPYQIWDSASIAGKGSNYIGFSDPEADRLIETARREMDPEKRLALWHQFHDLLHDLQPYTFLSASYSLTFIDNRLENTEPYKSGLNTGDWYVPAARQKYH